MSVLNLNKMFNPESVALIGASERKGALGNVVMKNLLADGFSGPILPVNPKYKKVNGVRAYQDIASSPVTPDLAVICTQRRASALGRKQMVSKPITRFTFEFPLTAKSGRSNYQIIMILRSD